MKAVTIIFLFFFLGASAVCAQDNKTDASIHETGKAIIKKAFDYYRGDASFSIVEMTVHRPDWERKITIKAWTRGDRDALFKITSPAKDKGNGTLKNGDDMWMFNPKVNRVIKLPPSMMSQAWMGSDFSNNDLAKSDTIVKDYQHRVTRIAEKQGVKTYTVESLPYADAPVVWGKLEFDVREDGILLRQGFYDEDKELVKEMITHDIKMIGHTLFPGVWKMSKKDTPDEYTQIEYFELRFEKSLPDRLFTKAGLKKKIR
ncbi:MAG: outer membrane lipoprotein-sorting protein [Thermodesulfobacteriota bacterium]|nr:outer membrane lipoprotein-sorting protein [Thermodesulfobacteriota bacterium]